MNDRSRTENSFRNAIVALGCQFSILIISFVSRWFFIRILGSQYLGISGLFTNVLSILSLADLGFSSAVAYSLYKPIAENDKDKISAIIRYFGNIYKIIAIVIFSIGLALIPFLDKLVSVEITIDDVRFFYILYLIETASSYLFVYKSIILSADQREYVTKGIRTLFTLVTNISKLVVLYVTNDFTAYLVVQIAEAIVTNFAISRRADKEYPFLRTNQTQLDKPSKKKIYTDVKALFIYKIGSVILYHTDNILISVMVNTTSVGFYSNYTLLTGTITTLSDLLFGALGASIGNKHVTSNKKDLLQTFKSINFANFWVYGFCSVCLFCLMDDFIELWIGREYVLGSFSAFIISFNVFIPGMLSAVSSFRNATGLFTQTKYVYMITAIFNLILSILLGKYMGLNGIILATGISRLLTNVWYEPYILIKKFFKASYVKYLLRLGLYYLCFLVPCFVIWIVKTNFFALSLWSFVLEAVVCVFGVNVMYFALFGRSVEFQDLKNKCLSIVRKYVGRNRK